MPRILKYKKISSTNSVLKDMINKSPIDFPDTVIISYKQTEGRGRLKRVFSSPEGGLYISLCFKEDEFKYPTATAAVYAMLAIADIGVQTKIKWLNDLYFNNKKVCGILAEKVHSYVIIGIGINITTEKSEFPKEIQNKAISLFPGEKSRLEELRNKLSKSLIENFYQKKPSNIFSLYKENCFTLNTQITVNSFDKTYEAMAIGINQDFELIIKDSENKICTLSTGEIILNQLQ
ncbi:MAG: biotin--[acetyl-CoA-carboxylase] ligase [Sphaerochaetaceae bacterium]|nr:biotin--[acetyl-CoA-carboxylase] ligase [Sphaerochaetaceae bacterium]